MVPHARAPRILLPADNPVASSRAMLRFSAALSPRDVLQRTGVAAVLRARGAAAFADRIVVQERVGSLRHHLANVLGEPVDLSIGLGTARANRKPVLQVFDARGRSLAFAKIGDNAVTERLVRREAESLRRLATAPLPARFEVPRLLHLGEWEGAAVLVMTSLATSVRQRPGRQYSVPHEEMVLLRGAFAETPRALVDTPLWTQVTGVRDRLPSSPATDRFADALAVLADTAGDRPVEVGAWHGDWTPWNMSRRRGRLQLWDWERFETGVPAGLDACHYGVNAVCRRDGASVEAVLRGLELAGVRRDGPAADHLVGGAYLAAITSRYLPDAATELGDAIAERSVVMLESLCTWVGLEERISRG